MAEILINKGKHKILYIMSEPLQLMELAGRTAYQSRDKITKESSIKFIEMLRKLGHESVLEHSAMTIEFNNISRGFTHELVRHRLASFTQESTRYVDEKDFRMIIKENEDTTVNINGKETSVLEWAEMNEKMYRGLREKGWKPEDARQFLPIGIQTQIVVTANFRQWRHIFKLRCADGAHWEIREVMRTLLKDVKERIPVVFDDLEY